MSWAEVKKINSDLSVPLNEKYRQLVEPLSDVLKASIIDVDAGDSIDFFNINGHGLLSQAIVYCDNNAGYHQVTIYVDGEEIMDWDDIENASSNVMGITTREYFPVTSASAYNASYSLMMARPLINNQVLEYNFAGTKINRNTGFDETYHPRKTTSSDGTLLGYVTKNPIEFTQNVTVRYTNKTGSSCGIKGSLIYCFLD